MVPWKLSDDEWEHLRLILEPSVVERPRGPGRPPSDCRATAEACLFRHFHSLSKGRSHTFHWNALPRELGVSPATANRYFRRWHERGDWIRFWDALADLRRAEVPRSGPPTPDAKADASPVSLILTELERAYRFFRLQCFAVDSLPPDVAITLDVAPSAQWAGLFCGRRWRREDREVNHIRINSTVLGEGSCRALEVLLHEMVHLRNHGIGIVDCTRCQYHNRHFRDAALLAGLECFDYDKAIGYGKTRLTPRGLEAVAKLRPREELFRWTTGPAAVTST